MMLSIVAFAGAKAVKRTVVFKSENLHCENCARKITENTGLEKGVIELDADVKTRTIKVLFNESKTDTARIAKSIRSLGYKAQVISYE